jgi:pimeloyl-ACP methyl ester carboxylesterase
MNCALDIPGWGDSSAATIGQLDHVTAAIQFLDALGIEKAAFVGNSMGGQASLRLATEHPDRISHLITMGPPVGRMPTLFGAGDGPSEGLKVLIQAYQDASPENMRRLVEIMIYDKARFATPELCQARPDAAPARPDHLSNYVIGLPRRPVRELALPAGEHPRQPAGAAQPLRPPGDDRVRRRIQPVGRRLRGEQLTWGSPDPTRSTTAHPLSCHRSCARQPASEELGLSPTSPHRPVTRREP